MISVKFYFYFLVLTFKTDYFSGIFRDSGMYYDGIEGFNNLIYAPFKGFLYLK
jgi:hypothetical protein